MDSYKLPISIIIKILEHGLLQIVPLLGIPVNKIYNRCALYRKCCKCDFSIAEAFIKGYDDVIDYLLADNVFKKHSLPTKMPVNERYEKIIKYCIKYNLENDIKKIREFIYIVSSFSIYKTISEYERYNFFQYVRNIDQYYRISLFDFDIILALLTVDENLYSMVDSNRNFDTPYVVVIIILKEAIQNDMLDLVEFISTYYNFNTSNYRKYMAFAAADSSVKKYFEECLAKCVDV